MTQSDSRKEVRVDKQEVVFIEILSTSVDDDSGLVVKCSTQDVSANGLKVTSSYPVSVGAFLELLVEFSEGSAKYLLTGEVKWCHQTSADPTYQCGFELLQAEHSDIRHWQRLFESESRTLV